MRRASLDANSFGCRRAAAARRLGFSTKTQRTVGRVRRDARIFASDLAVDLALGSAPPPLVFWACSFFFVAAAPLSGSHANDTTPHSNQPRAPPISDASAHALVAGRVSQRRSPRSEAPEAAAVARIEPGHRTPRPPPRRLCPCNPLRRRAASLTACREPIPTPWAAARPRSRARRPLQ